MPLNTRFLAHLPDCEASKAVVLYLENESRKHLKRPCNRVGAVEVPN